MIAKLSPPVFDYERKVNAGNGDTVIYSVAFFPSVFHGKEKFPLWHFAFSKITPGVVKKINLKYQFWIRQEKREKKVH